MRFSIILTFIAALAMATPAGAYDTPKDLVSAIYAPYLSGGQQADLQQFYSTALKQHFADYSERLAATEATAGREPADGSSSVLDFNPFIDAQHALLLDLVIGEPAIVGERAVLTVSFHNFDQPSLLSIAVVKEADGWKVDDVSSMGEGEHWMLSWLLLYDPWS